MAASSHLASAVARAIGRDQSHLGRHYGLPLVVAPMRDDQPIIAQQVADAGAGIPLSIGEQRATEVRDAVRVVLDDPSYRAAAGAVRDSFVAAGGASAAADHVEKLL